MLMMKKMNLFPTAEWTVIEMELFQQEKIDSEEIQEIKLYQLMVNLLFWTDVIRITQSRELTY